LKDFIVEGWFVCLFVCLFLAALDTLSDGRR
jgi:hypothetical protein